MSGLGSTNRSLFQALVVVVILVAAGIGARVDWLWWPVTSGLMLTLTAIAIGVVGGVLAFTRGVARRAGLVGLAVSVGLLAGQNLGPSREPLHNLEGTITLRLTSPVHGVATGAVSCSTVADATEVSVSSDPNLRLDTPDRPFVSISIDVGDRWVVLRDSPRNDGVYLLITVTPTRVPDDGEPATIGMAATETSTLSTTFASESGYVTFADLGPQFGVDFTGERLELAGMIEWTCDRDPSEGVDPDVVGQG